MRFGSVPVVEAQGTILAHSIDPGGASSLDFSKGVLLSADHVAALVGRGVAEVTVARLDPGDLHEDAAAARIADALCGSGLVASGAATGRVNLRASAAGIVEVDPDAINTINRINPAITVATVAEWARLNARGLAVTVKIIPFAAPEVDVARACAAGHGAVHLRGPTLGHASLIETRTGEADPPEKGRQSVKGRLDRLSVALGERVIVPHRIAEIAFALTHAPGELLLILTGSATSDTLDIAPQAVRAAGGEVLHYGMPVDPGNLLVLGRIGTRPVIGLPGCARSPALNGADWVMERVICGVPLNRIDIPGMGVGGLLKEIPSRPRPREG
ncbi:molybdopterin-binding protein [Hasllibacter sp. MH4015]|uniref:molybdopterin-binding protein n=1 Tax=Hasllibacter sp. MH4015 TaxID=2854029 RepID=UPI001CD1FBCE|nr:molybdopterin-binding protein [Hasllibacter sp. MH4015]